MALPLYKGVSHTPPHLHGGLLFDKFFNWEKLGTKADSANKDRYLKLFNKDWGDQASLERAKQQIIAIVEYLNGQMAIFKNEWRFVTGMGIDHPLENGLSWHPTLGVPYLAGSGVKGLLRAWCKTWEEFDEAKIERWFGKNSEKDEQGNAGRLIFFDALPVAPVVISSDVMTPHMGDWYEQGKTDHSPETIPADWHSPNPIKFLSIKECKLLFAIAPRRPEFVNDAIEAMELLTNALKWMGAGAKTAVGYGRFIKDPKANGELNDRIEAIQKAREESQKEATLATLPLIDRLFEKYKTIPDLVRALDNGEFEEETKEAAKRIKELMMGTKNEWDEKGNPAKSKAAKRTLIVMKYLDE
ncbi:MAG: type III-B CRISPR module RAMP protein Cmr6 [Campylobacterales bacterium]